MEEDTQVERTANVAAAEARVANILLMEMMDTLRTRGLVTRADIAAALLRMEWRAAIADAGAKTDGLIAHHAEIAKQTTSEWETRLGLPPELYTLRKEQQEWEATGSQGKSPLAAELAIEYYSDPDQ